MHDVWKRNEILTSVREKRGADAEGVRKFQPHLISNGV